MTTIKQQAFAIFDEHGPDFSTAIYSRVLQCSRRAVQEYRNQWRKAQDPQVVTIHCPCCGLVIDKPGECELCQLQRQGQVVLYQRLEALHG